MARARATSSASTTSMQPTNQELGSMYDYLAKIILLGPSGAGKSCLLHRFVHHSYRILSSQTIGVEFSSKIISIGTSPHHRKRIKLQLWDTAGTERFRSVSRSYYRGAAGAILVYDVSSWRSFAGLGEFLSDARALASRDLCVVLAGNKADVVDGGASARDIIPDGVGGARGRGNSGGGGGLYDSYASTPSESLPPPTPSSQSSYSTSLHPKTPAYTIAPEGREVPPETASRWASENGIPVAVEVSALSGDNVDELFNKLARMILTKIELGEIDPDDPGSGIQYGDIGGWNGMGDDGASVRSGEGGGTARRRKKGYGEWGEVFRLSGSGRRRGGCC